MKPNVAVFSRTAPVNKADLWRCFKRDLSGFATVQVDEAHSLIGKNAPRYLERQGYLIKDTRPDGDFYSLTMVGIAWLVNGIKSYAKNHPSERDSIPFFPEDAPAGRRILRKR